MDSDLYSSHWLHLDLESNRRLWLDSDFKSSPATSESLFSGII